MNRFCGSSMTGHPHRRRPDRHRRGRGVRLRGCGVDDPRTAGPETRRPPNPSLKAEWPQVYATMGETAENVATQFGVGPARTRSSSRWSRTSKAAAAQAAGRLVDEIARVQTPDGWVAQDGCIRPTTSLEGLCRPQARVPAGRLGDRRHVVAADRRCCRAPSALLGGLRPPPGLAILAASAGHRRGRGARPRSWAWARCRPPARRWPAPASPWPTSTSSRSTRRSAARPWPACASSEIPRGKVNLDGGGLAIGHPLGATGARITAKAAQLLAARRRPLRPRHAMHRRRPGHRHVAGSGVVSAAGGPRRAALHGRQRCGTP